MNNERAGEISPSLARSGRLGRFGAGVMALGGGLGEMVPPPAPRSATAPTSPTTFGRMLPNLPPFAEATNKV
jgi:hypothetical protein